ncbi:hypothetical membrane protein [Actinomycetales bacterium JB111]|nr:hypothetical membrane protein [Actinomycetales bacterium JB111]
MDMLDVVAWGVLVALVATAVLGVTSLVLWRRHGAAGFPTAKVAAHVTLQVVSIALWVVFLLTTSPWLAWLTFGVITAGQVVGDLLMFASYRARRRVDRVGSYLAAAGELLRFSRPIPALHALIGAVGWFGMLLACLLATLA